MYRTVFVICVLIASAYCTYQHEDPVDHNELDSIKKGLKELAEMKAHIKELRDLSERTRIAQQLSALAFYQDFVVNAEINDWSWLCKEFLTEDVEMTVFTTNGTYSHLQSNYSTLSQIHYESCANVTRFYDQTISSMFGFMYHPYANPWIELFENGTANSLVSGMNNAVVKVQDKRLAFWSFAYYAFGWIKTEQGWRINRFIHLSSFTVPYQGEGWANVPVPFTNVYDMILTDYPLLGKQFRELMLHVQPLKRQGN